MRTVRRLLPGLTVVALVALLVLLPGRPAQAYIMAPHPLGLICTLSTNVLVVRVEKVDKEKNLIIYRKEQDLKGRHPVDVIKNNIGRGGFHPREWQYIMEWAEPGKLAVMFHNGGAAEVCTGNYWYQVSNGGEWWGLTHGEPYLLRSFAGRAEKLAAALPDVLAGKEVVLPCMTDGNLDDLALRKAKIQRLKASLKIQDYNPKRDFVGWGGEDLRRVAGMPAFTHLAALPAVGPEAQGVSCPDFDGDGKPDICLLGGGKLALLQNGGEAFGEMSLPGVTGARSAVWADYNLDGKPDLLLATPTGPKLFTNLGNGQFRDDTAMLPVEPAYNLTAAAWIDYDGDGRPDILLANGFHGLRLYRNVLTKDDIAQMAPPKLGDWYYIGPFRNPGGSGFDTVFPPEQEIDLKKEYEGRSKQKAVWKKGNFTDGQVNNLALFLPEYNTQSLCYLYREIDASGPAELPVSLGSDDTLTVWLNGEKIHAENVNRAAAPDQAKLTLRLKKGKNRLLMKICQGDGEWAFYFQAGTAAVRPTISFEDISAKVGLGPDGIGSQVKGDSLSVADVNGDGRPDFLYGAGRGLLVLNTPAGFVAKPDSGIDYTPGGVGPVFGDFNNDGRPDLFVPQSTGCKLFRNNGDGTFTDATAQSGDLGKPIGQAVCAAWGDLGNTGRQDLVVGCLRGVNRYFRNNGDGTFTDATADIGLHQKVFNTRGIALVDLNNDGALDLVMNNEGQESVLLLGNPTRNVGRVAVTVQVGGPGALGSRVRVLDGTGKSVAADQITGADGRGGQRASLARFALPPGQYKLEARDSTGKVREKALVVGSAPQRTVIE
jgi:hypothetical protein